MMYKVKPKQESSPTQSEFRRLHTVTPSAKKLTTSIFSIYL